MRNFVCIAVGLLAAAGSHLCAESVGTIITVFGRTYHDCQIVRVHPDGVSFIHNHGAAKILFDDLAPEWRLKLGYDRKKEEAYEQELADRRQRQAEARAARELELAKALTAAHQMEVERLRTQRIQALGMQAMAFNSNPWPWGLPVGGFAGLPSLGAIHDGRSIYRGSRRSRVTWEPRGLVPLAPGTGGVVAFSSGGIQFFRPGLWCSPTLGCYLPGGGFPVGHHGGGGIGVVGRPATTVISVPR